MPYRSACMTASIHRQSEWQRFARAEIEKANDTTLDPWNYAVPLCDTDWCISAEHLAVVAPTKIAYPAGVCVYCGMPSGTKDHLIPRGWSGEARRRTVAVVPACADCNSRINDFPSANVTDRRVRAHESLRKAKRRVLSAPTWTEDMYAELGRSLRSGVEALQTQKQVVELRLAWPEDADYDLRAFQHSGIDNPEALGLI